MVCCTRKLPGCRRRTCGGEQLLSTSFLGSIFILLSQRVIWDVFLLDSDSKIERPERVYRQGINLFHYHKYETETTPKEHHEKDINNEKQTTHGDARNGRTLRGVKDIVERALHLGHIRPDRANSMTVASINRVRARLHERSSENNALGDGSDGGDGDGDSPDAESESEAESEVQDPPQVDPSTNVDPVQDASAKGENGNANPDPEGVAAQEAKKRKGKRRNDKNVSKHTFFVINSQMRLKLFATNEVCLAECFVGDVWN